MITITNKIDMYPGGLPVVIHLSQYDSDFTLAFELYSSAGTFTIQSGTTAIIRGTKTDGNGYDATATISDNTVTVTGDEQMTAAAGFNEFELVLTKNDKELSTANFIIDVEKAAMDAETITSESVLMELNAIIAGAETATQAASAAAASAEAAAASAQTLVIDDTLTRSGQAADAKATGDEIADLRADLDQIEGLSSEAKAALLDCVAHAPWTDANGQTYYNALYAALYDNSWIITNNLTYCTNSNTSGGVTKGHAYTATITANVGYTLSSVTVTMSGVDITSSVYSNGLISIASVTGDVVITASATALTISSISAVYTPTDVVYSTDSLSKLKGDLVVTATYTDSSTATIPAADYTLSGTLAFGTSTITASYSGLTDTFNVTVTSAPDIASGEIVQGYYFDASGNEVSSGNAVINRTYYEIEPSTEYVWTQGFSGNYYSSSAYVGVCNSYRICFYDENKNFLSRITNSNYSTAFGYIEPRTHTFTTPEDAAYVRFAWNYLPTGLVAETTPTDLYAVTLVLAYDDDSTISDKSDLSGRVTFLRNGTDITAEVMYNGETPDSTHADWYWRGSIFNFTSGGTPEEGPQSESDTRIYNNKSFLLKSGDIIRFNNVKYGVRCEKVSDSTLAYTSAWVTDNADYVIGG